MILMKEKLQITPITSISGRPIEKQVFDVAHPLRFLLKR